MRGAVHGGKADQVRRVRLALERCKNEIREIIAGGAAPAGPERSGNAPAEGPVSA